MKIENCKLKNQGTWEVVVAQLKRQLLTTPEDRTSNPIHQQQFFRLKPKINKKRPGKAHLEKPRLLNMHNNYFTDFFCRYG